MNQEHILEKLTERFGKEIILGSVDFRGQTTAIVEKDKILEICRFLRDEPVLKFNHLSFVGGVDRFPSQPRFEVVYQLYSHRHNHRFRIKAQLEEPAEGLASIDSVVPIWISADWHERETAEMYGMTFNNHPDPRKLLMADHWKAYPLRKDFPLQGTQEATPDLPAKTR
jgi:NADH-quinone oxidoreductase subunit C